MRCAAATMLVVAALMASAPASARRVAATPAVAAAAAGQPETAAVLAIVDGMDQALIDDDHPAFTALLAPDLVVNHPQNSVSGPGATARLAASGRIRYSSYQRSIE